MGYTPKLRVLSLDFSDTEYPEIKIAASSCTVRDWHAIAPSTDMTDDEVIEFLARKITEWNLQDEFGSTIPITAEAINELDYDLVRDILIKYQIAVRGIPSSLGKDLTDGESQMVESIPMDPS